MQNIGAGPLNGALSGVQRAAKRGLITTVGYKLKGRPACYALEGSIKIAGAALTWLRDNMQLIKNYEECDELINSTTNAAGVFFVPALGGLYSPYWDPNAAGLFIGLSQFSRREHLVRATFDSIAYQTNDILSIMRGVTNGLMIDGGLCKSDNMCQILADITGCDIVRPAMCETSALGAAMVAGCGAGIWSYESMLANSNTPYEYSSSSNQNHHYPHESLHYEEKFSSLIASRNNTSIEARATVINDAGGGGGINDDAGGGGGGGSSLAFYDDVLESDDATTSGEFASNSSDDIVCQQELAAVLNPPVDLENEQPISIESGAEMSPEAVAGGADNSHLRLNPTTGRLFYPSPSSGYTSAGDNFEATTSNSTTSSSPSELLARRHSPTSINSQVSSTLESSSECHLLAQDHPELIENNQQSNVNDIMCFQNQLDQTAADTNVGSRDQLFLEEGEEPLNELPTTKLVDVFQSYISLEHRTELVATWRLAVERSMAWTKIHHEEIRRIDYQRLSSLPISMYLFFSIGMVALSGFIRSSV